jgi:hypothetical protein
VQGFESAPANWQNACTAISESLVGYRTLLWWIFFASEHLPLSIDEVNSGAALADNPFEIVF